VDGVVSRRVVRDTEVLQGVRAGAEKFLVTKFGAALPLAVRRLSSRHFQVVGSNGRHDRVNQRQTGGKRNEDDRIGGRIRYRRWFGGVSSASAAPASSTGINGAATNMSLIQDAAYACRRIKVCRRDYYGRRHCRWTRVCRVW